LIYSINPFTGNFDKSEYFCVSDSVNAGITKQILSMPLSAFNDIDFFLGMKSFDGTKSKMLKMSVNQTNGAVYETIYSIAGIYINLSIVVSVSGLNAIIQVTNNESFNINLFFKYKTI
jgi:hypothetical protein